MANTTKRRFMPMLALALAAACSGGGGGMAPAAVDVTGYWQLYLTPAGGAESGPGCVYLAQTGNSVDGAEISGSVSGITVSLTAAAQAFTIVINGTAVGDSISGTLSISGLITGTGTFRMQRFAPTGTMSVAGTIGSSAVALDIATAVGARSYSDAARTVLEQVMITAAIGDEHCEIDFTPAGLAIGAFGVPGTVVATVTYRNDSVELDLTAGSGTLTVTRYDGSGFAGSYTLTLSGGGSISGSFDVAWDIAAYDP